MKNNDVIVTPERNGFLNPDAKLKYRNMAASLDGMIGAYMHNSLDGVIGDKAFRENSRPRWAQADVRYNTMVPFCERIKPSLIDEFTGRICPLKCCKKITEWGGVLVPVIWNKKSEAGSAVHIRKEEGEQSWVYLNLNITTPEFVFSALRELGRLVIISLLDGWNQEFASRLFATSILMNEDDTSFHYNELQSKTLNLSNQQKVNYIVGLAIEKEIPPLAILWRLDKFTYNNKREQLKLGKQIVRRFSEFDSHFNTELSRISCYNDWHDEPKNRREYESLTRYFDSDFMSIFNEYSSSLGELEKSRLGAKVTMMNQGIFRTQ